ncbi:MAG: hypothetical protein ACFFC7_32345 [Candidatus Hermodarchaeota archaeon]
MLNKRHVLIFFLLFTIIPVLLAADEPVSKPHDTAVTINLTKDLISFIKIAVWIFGIFIAILAFLGVAFFGFDVRKARAAIQDSLNEIREIMDQATILKGSIESTYSELEDLKDKFTRTTEEAENYIQELGAQVEELTESVSTKRDTIQENAKDKFVSDNERAENYLEDELGHQVALPTPSWRESCEDSDKADQSSDETYVEDEENKRSIQDLLVEIITGSSFKWTTIKRLMNKTGLSRDEILDYARKNPKIEISLGKKGKDHIFRIKGINT